jgi:uncharacterized protein (TIGR04255 family)
VRFPETTREVYETTPTVEVICQLRFPVILAIGTEPPAAFQDAIRQHFPVYRRDDGPAVPPQLAQLIGQLPFPVGPEATTHWFETADAARSIALGSQFVAVSERSYTEWSDLRPKIELALDALCNVYRPAFFERIGLRYRDAIDRQRLDLGERRWDELIKPPLAGLLGAEEAIQRDVREAGYTAVLSLDEPPNASVVLQAGLEAHDRFIIDADFFLEERKERDDATLALDNFNVEAGRLFRWAIRDPVRQALVVRDS